MSLQKLVHTTLFPILAACFILAAGCRPQQSADGGAMPQGPADQATVVATGARRADPGYIQYLERLSMLGSQTELARVVSGSQLAWLRPADAPFPDPLLDLADSWITINPYAMLPEAKRNVFATLASPAYWQYVTKSRLGGMYFSPVSGSGALWAYNRKASASGDDVIQYTFAEVAGSENDYFRLLTAANSHKKLLGLELTPATTGLGPDFFLAARYHRQFSGIYCMVELPSKVWPNLPPVSDQWHGVALSDEQIAALAANNLLPLVMVQDSFPTGKEGGWAVTSEIHGVDGLVRRWAYRYYGAPDRPVLNWEDPSAGARRMLSGSAIRSVGMLGGALVGMRMEGLYGLDATVPNSKVRFSAAPGDEAARAVSREVRRYGGWSWLKDAIPLSLVAELMPDGPDFFADTIFSPGIEHALLTGSTAVLDAMVDDALFLGLDMRRFVHATSAEQGVSYLFPHFAEVAAGNRDGSALRPQQAATLQKEALSHAQQAVYGADLNSPRGTDTPPLHEKHLNTTTAGVAALALGKGNAASVSKEDWPLLRDGHFLPVFARAMLPGLFMLSGQDMAGTLPLSWYTMATSSGNWDPALGSRGAYAFTQSIQDTAVTAQGVPKAKAIYPTADVQLLSEDSFIARLADILAIRTMYGVAKGTLHGRFVTEVPGCFAYAVILPPQEEPKSQEQTGEDAAPPSAPAETATFSTASEPGKDEQATLKQSGRKLGIAERRKLAHEENERQRAQLERRIITAPIQEKSPRHGDAAIIAVFNFSRDPVREVLNLSHDATLQRFREKGEPLLLTKNKGAVDGAEVTMSFGPKTVTLTLPPWRGAVVHIGKR
ncbi:hypothetical protein LJC26_07960 [Desulfovibrio sp. OttesenSCG-928-O18]|nr:hypothetical protein [Desulfovibrio sp. OttesenSCG-928-O18]